MPVTIPSKGPTDLESRKKMIVNVVVNSNAQRLNLVKSRGKSHTSSKLIFKTRLRCKKFILLCLNGVKFGSVYFIVKTAVEAATKRKLLKGRKNYVKLHSDRKAKRTPKEQSPLFSLKIFSFSGFWSFGAFQS